METLIDNFVNEAISAPSLFMDLAKVELYIAESYRARALIELIQNADDSGATEFTAHQNGQDLIVTNNGRLFDDNDILALCRSGSSTKKRGAGTIGYRGIGFKSTIGICNEVEVYSGNYSFLFSRSLTQKTIGTVDDVPLIRIPHKIVHAYSFPIDIKREDSSTIFVFKDVNFRVVNEEINKIDLGSCIFLNNIKSIDLSTTSVEKKFIVESLDSKKTIKSGEGVETWVVFEGLYTSSNCKVAMKLQDDEIQMANRDEALIHAFLPTQESSGAGLKFNGDFSTDPSRKFVDFDEKSEASYFYCCQILAGLIQEAISNKLYTGIYRVFNNVDSGNKSKLRDKLLNILEYSISIYGVSCKFSDLRTCPDWLSYTDYNNLKASKKIIPQELVEEHPDIVSFLSWMGVKNFTSSDILFNSDFSGLSLHGVVSLVGNYAKKHRFTLERNQLDKLGILNIIPYENKLVSPRYILENSIELPESTLDILEKSECESDIKSLFKSLDLMGSPAQDKFNFQSKLVDKNKGSKLNISSNIKKWRSAELNLKEYLSQFKSVLKVTDVSKAHVGYDLKVQLKSGGFMYVEVKSVKDLNSEFEITNNEFAVASDLGESYFIALVVDSEREFDVRLIKNPINVLNFEKRIKVTSWVCGAYDEKIEYAKDML